MSLLTFITILFSITCIIALILLIILLRTFKRLIKLKKEKEIAQKDAKYYQKQLITRYYGNDHEQFNLENEIKK